MEKTKKRKQRKLTQEEVDEMARKAILRIFEEVLSRENLERTIKLTVDKIRGVVR